MNSSSSNFIFSSELSNIPKVFDWLESKLFKLIKNQDKKNTLSLVIQEALANAIIHGNKENKDKNVTLSYCIDKSQISIEVKDEGEGVAIENKRKDSEHMKTEDLLKDSGRGIILMKHFCKDVIFKKNSIKLIVEL